MPDRAQLGPWRIARGALVASTAIVVLVGVIFAAPGAPQGFATGSATSGSAGSSAPLTPRQEEKLFLDAYCHGNTATAIPSGTEAEARKYYSDLAPRIGLQIQDPPTGQPGPTTKLDDLVKYLGYSPASSVKPDLTARELQDASPADLMDPSKLGDRLGLRLSAGDVLVARFFAPKVSDVSGPKVTKAGWRFSAREN